MENGHVMLGGVVDTVTELSLAEGLVDGSIIGVKLVVKNITVRPAVSGCLRKRQLNWLGA